MAQMRTRPTRPTRGDTGPSQHGRHPPPTLHHGSLRAPPEAPHSTRPTLPKSSPPRPAAGRKRGGARGRQRRRHRSPARAAAPPGRRSRSRTSWSSAGATARMQRRSELRPVSHTNAGAGGGPRGMGCEGGARKGGRRRGMFAAHRAEVAHLFRRVGAPTSEILSAETARGGHRDVGCSPTARAPLNQKSGPPVWHAHVSGPCHMGGPAIGIGRARAVRVTPCETAKTRRKASFTAP